MERDSSATAFERFGERGGERVGWGCNEVETKQKLAQPQLYYCPPLFHRQLSVAAPPLNDPSPLPGSRPEIIFSTEGTRIFPLLKN